MSTPSDLVIPEEDLARQAVASLRGYAYQVWSSALAWTALQDAETLLLEVAEDFSLLSADALALRQSKDTAQSGSATLRTRGVVDAINTLWRFRQANPAKAVSMVYLTTSTVGREQGVNFPSDVPGLTHWRAAAHDGVDLSNLRGFLATLALETELKTWLETASDDEVRAALLQRVRWECGQPPLQDLDALLDEALTLLCEAHGGLPGSEKVVRDVILVDLLRAATNDNPAQRQRTRTQLLELVERTLAGAAPAVLKALVSAARGGGGAEVLEPLTTTQTGALAIWRPDAAASLTRALTQSVGWLYGASGAGKTALASSVTRLSNRSWRIVDLRDLAAAEAKRRLRDARGELSALSDVAGVVVDDIPVAAVASLKREILLLKAQLERSDAALLLVSYNPPPPSLSADLGLAKDAILQAPYFSEAETGALITAAGGDAELWMRSVHLSCASGHPQLVAARVSGLRSRGWDTSEMQDILEPAGPRDIEVERDSVRDRLYQELPADARSLLYRLSLLTGGFDRKLAMDLGAVAHPIAEPGAAVDLLTGAWLEPRPGNRLRVSPLVADAGVRVLAPAAVTAVHEAIAESLADRTPFPASQLPQLLMSGLASRHRKGLSIVAAAALSAQLSAEDLASTLFMLPLLRTDRPLVEGDEDLNRVLRIAQLKVASGQDDAARLLSIYRRFLVEIETADEPAGQRAIAAWIMLATDAHLPPSEWFGPLANMHVWPIPLDPKGTSQAAKLADVNEDFAANPALVMFTLRTMKLRGVADLEAWFSALDDLPPDRRRMYLDGLPEPQAGRHNALHMSWVKDSEAAGFDPGDTAARYGALRRRAEAWADDALAVECVSCQAVLLAEYADDSEGALALLKEAEGAWPGHARLRREMAKILFNQKRFADVLASGPELVAGMEDGAPIERVNILRELGLSAAETGDFGAAIHRFTDAEAITADAGNLDAVAVGLQADRAFLTWRSGDRQAGLEVAREALLAAETMNSETDRAQYVLRALHSIALCMHQDLTAPGWDANITTVYGIASRAPQEPAGSPTPNLLATWYQLATVERLSGLDAGVTGLRDARTQTGRIVSLEYLRRTSEYMDTLRAGGPQGVLDGLSEFVRCAAFAQSKGTAAPSPAADSKIFDIVKAMPWDGPFDPSDTSLCDYAEEALLLSCAFAIARGEGDWVARLKAATISDSGVAKAVKDLPEEPELNAAEPKSAAILWALTQIAAADPAPRDLQLATIRIWEWLGYSMLKPELAAALGPQLAKQWRTVATHAQFALRTPAIHAPAILAAAEEVTERAHVARLVLAASEAIPLNLQPSLMQKVWDSAIPTLTPKALDAPAG